VQRSKIGVLDPNNHENAMSSRRIAPFALAKIWNVTDERVRQLKVEGKIKIGADGKYDFDEAMAFRKAQVDENTVQTLFQTYTTPTGMHQPKVFDQLKVVDLDADVFDDAPTAPAAQANPNAVVEQAVSAQASLTAARAANEQLKLDRARIRHLVEDGKLIDRTDVFRASQAAAADISSTLHTLEYEIADLFSDHDIRNETREKVARLVDRALYALHKKFDAMARPLTEDEI